MQNLVSRMFASVLTLASSLIAGLMAILAPPGMSPSNVTAFQLVNSSLTTQTTRRIRDLQLRRRAFKRSVLAGFTLTPNRNFKYQPTAIMTEEVTPRYLVSRMVTSKMGSSTYAEQFGIEEEGFRLARSWVTRMAQFAQTFQNSIRHGFGFSGIGIAPRLRTTGFLA